MKQCKKQTTVAIIMKDNKFISFGSNSISNDIEECPRKGMKTGEGYELCKNVCGQLFHAEVDACNNALEDINGATLYLIGHTYCCDNCLNVMKNKGIKTVMFCESSKKLEL